MKKAYSFIRVQSRRATLLILLLVCSVVSYAQQGGPLLYEVATPNVGNAYAGQAAVAHDASTAYLNPAAMSEVDESQWLVGIQGSFSMLKFNGMDNASQFTPSLAAYWLKHISDKWTLGATLNLPQVSMLDYGNDWSGKYYLTERRVVMAHFSPAASFRLNDQWSFGGAINLYLGMLSQDAVVPSTKDGMPEGMAEVEGSALSMGFQAGVHFRADENTTLGLMYRYRATVDIQGSADVSNYYVNDQKATSLRYSTDLLVPHAVNLSMSHFFGSFEFLVDVGYTNWQAYRYEPLILKEHYSMDDGAEWKDTYRIGVGGNYTINTGWILRAGFSYDSAPVDEAYNSVDIPVSEMYRFAIGGTKIFADKHTLSLSYCYGAGDNTRINQVSNVQGNLIGEFDPLRNHTIALSFGF